MKKSEAVVGTKVLASCGHDEWGDGDHLAPYCFDEYDDSTFVGVICEKKCSPGKVWVKWIEGSLEGDEEEVDLKLLTLASKRGEMEKEFKSTLKKIKEKMKQAGDLVREADKMAKKARAKSLADMYDAVDPLVNAMDASGWRSSSWGC